MESNQPNYTFTCSRLKSFTSLIFSSLMTWAIMLELIDDIPYAVPIYRRDEEVCRL